MNLVQRLGKVEETALRIGVALSAREQARRREVIRDVLGQLSLRPGMSDVIEVVVGNGVWRGQEFVHPDETEIERAIIQIDAAMPDVLADMGQPCQPDRGGWRFSSGFMPTEDDSDLGRAMCRFAAASTSNLAVALRYENSRRFAPQDEAQVAERRAAEAVFAPRFAAFIAEEERRSQRRDRRGAGVRA